MIEIQVTYDGGLHCTATHTPSQATLITDAPKDNGGEGSSFSPTDLMATALATCIATTMDLYARRHDIALIGTRVTTTKQMSTDAPRRIVALPTEVRFPIPNPGHHGEILERTAHTCPVHQSLHPDIEKPIAFFWADSEE